MHEYIREHDLQDTPPIDKLRTAFPSMVAAVVQVHFPNNGWSRFIRSCGLSPLRVPKGLLSQEYVDEVLLQILSVSDTPHIMPTETQMRALARDPEYSMRREAASLSVSIGRPRQFLLAARIDFVCACLHLCVEHSRQACLHSALTGCNFTMTHQLAYALHMIEQTVHAANQHVLCYCWPP